MRFLILLFPVMVLAQPNFSINESEYRRRIDNILNLREILIDQGIRGVILRDYRNDIVKNKKLAVLQQLETLEQIKRNEKALKKTDLLEAINFYEEKYLAKKYLKTLDINSLNTEEKKKEFFNAVKILLESY